MPWLGAAARLLDEPERARAGRMKRARDADTRTLAYALHRLFLGAVMGIEARSVPLSRDARGCPVVGDGDWRTSLSHADGAIAFAASPACVVGIDVEHADRAAETIAIADEIWHPTERAAMENATRAQHSRALLETWARKEAYLKAAGTGLVESMARFALPEGAILPLATADGEGRAGQVRTGLLELVPDYVVALASRPSLSVHAMLLEPS